jgi:shikimate dehydrogenase
MTMQLGVIGDPIDHSLSPILQEAAIRSSNIDAHYKRYHVKLGELKQFIEDMRSTEIRGINITIPHKENVVPFLDELSADVQNIGAVNTIDNKSGRLIGYNTDAKAYLRSLQEDVDYEVREKTITIIGAGGAARAVAYGLASAQAKHIFIVNRTEEKAQKIVANLAKNFRDQLSALQLNNKILEGILFQSDLLINASSIGLNGSSFDSLPMEKLPSHALVSDLVYNPAETPLLRDAKALGLKTHGGLGMLLYQGAASFEIWTGQKPDINAMRTALEDHFVGKI